ncbi:MAG: DALR anticodon-binding domain-containing protein, partial [Pseudomonadota bacterium]
ALYNDHLADVITKARETEFVDQDYAEKRIEEHEKAQLAGLISAEAVSDFERRGENLLHFLLDRLRVYLRDQGHRHDVIDAVIAQGGDDLLAISRRVEALGTFLSESDGEDLVQGYKRAANILRAEEKKTSKPSAHPGESRDPAYGSAESGTGSQIKFGMSGVEYSADEARSLAEALTKTRPAIDAALSSTDYPAALSALADLRDPIDAFFEAVVVNSDNPEERARRLALLSAVVDTFHRIADFSRLDG